MNESMKEKLDRVGDCLSKLDDLLGAVSESAKRAAGGVGNFLELLESNRRLERENEMLLKHLGELTRDNVSKPPAPPEAPQYPAAASDERSRFERSHRLGIAACNCSKCGKACYVTGRSNAPGADRFELTCSARFGGCGNVVERTLPW